jgi:hypothetical protein
LRRYIKQHIPTSPTDGTSKTTCMITQCRDDEKSSVQGRRDSMGHDCATCLPAVEALSFG